MTSLAISHAVDDLRIPAPDRHERVALWLLAAVPSWLTLVLLGRVHPDEVFQMLEPAFVRAHGYGTLSWEWHAGLRNWAVPGLLSGIVRVCDRLGIQHPVAVRAAMAVPQLALHAAVLASVFAYVRRRSSLLAARLAVVLFALSGPVLVYAGRTLSESISAAFVVLAVNALDRDEDTRRQAVGAGLALGLAVVSRYGSLMFVATAIAWLALRRRWVALGWMLVALAGVALALGALDRVTWGRWFGSLVSYLRFNVTSGRVAERFGASPVSFYLPLVAQFVPAWVWFGAIWALRERSRPSLATIMTATYLAAILWSPHKEGRFLYPALVLAMLAALPEVATIATRARHRGAAMAMLLAVGAVPAVVQPSLRSDLFRATVAITRDPDAHGLLIAGDPAWTTGGSFWIGRDIPWRADDSLDRLEDAARDVRFDRALGRGDRARAWLERNGFRMTGRVGDETMFARP